MMRGGLAPFFFSPPKERDSNCVYIVNDRFTITQQQNCQMDEAHQKPVRVKREGGIIYG